MGGVNIYPLSDPTNIHTVDTPEERKTYTQIYSLFENYLSNMTFDVVGG